MCVVNLHVASEYGRFSDGSWRYVSEFSVYLVDAEAGD
jgi:hypothetical protein